MGGFNPVSLAETATSSIFGLGSQIASNRSNQKINAQNIAASYNMQDRANEFTAQMFDKANAEYDRRFAKESAYNSAASQRDRLEAAGLNPYLMMNGGSAGVGTSTPVTAPSGASGSVPAAIPNKALQLEINGALQRSLDVDIAKGERDKRKAEAQIAQSDAAVREQENQLRIEQLGQQIDELRKRNKGHDLDNTGKEIANEIAGATKAARIEAGLKEPDMMDQQIQAIQLSNQATAAGLPYIAPMAAANLQRTLQEVLNTKETRKLIQAQTNESWKKAALLITQELETAARKEGIKLDNKQKQRLMPIVISNARQEGWLLNSQRRLTDAQADWQSHQNWLIDTDFDDMTWSQFLEYASRNWSSPVHGNLLLNTNNVKKSPKPVKGFK